jgi:hypothetical protein
MSFLTPQIEGSLPIQSSAGRFLEALRQRVAAGLLSGQPHPRSNYRVVEAGAGVIQVRAADWWTAINVGLNELEIRLEPPGSLQYRVRYWRWAGYALGLSGILGLIGVVLLLTFDVRGYIARHRSSWVPGFSLDQHLLFAWTMVLFWGFVWPWLLIGLHKSPLRRMVTRLIAEIDDRAAA